VSGCCDISGLSERENVLARTASNRRLAKTTIAVQLARSFPAVGGNLALGEFGRHGTVRSGGRRRNAVISMSFGGIVEGILASSYPRGRIRTLTRQASLPGTTVRDIDQPRAGNWWLPAENAALLRFDGSESKTFSRERGPTSLALRCTSEKRTGRLWAGGYLGLYPLEGESFVRVSTHGPW
jgi:hypothetical protein